MTYRCHHDRSSRRYVLLSPAGQELHAWEDRYPAHRGVCHRYAAMKTTGRFFHGR